MNQSIYLMLGVPYTVLFVGGFLIYRGMKKNDAYRRDQSASRFEAMDGLNADKEGRLG